MLDREASDSVVSGPGIEVFMAITNLVVSTYAHSLNFLDATILIVPEHLAFAMRGTCCVSRERSMFARLVFLTASD